MFLREPDYSFRHFQTVKFKIGENLKGIIAKLLIPWNPQIFHGAPLNP